MSGLIMLDVAHFIPAGPIKLFGDCTLMFLPIKDSTARRQEISVVITAALLPESWATPYLSSWYERAVSEATILAHHVYSCTQENIKIVMYYEFIDFDWLVIIFMLSVGTQVY